MPSQTTRNLVPDQSAVSPDLITVLRSRGKLKLTKTWRADGSISSYDDAKNFIPSAHQVGGIHELSELLTRLEGDAQACVIRGRLKDASAKTTRRILEAVDDLPLHAVLIDVDKFEPLAADPVEDPAACAEEFIAAHLPPAFAGRSFHWQLSSSAGAPGNAHLLKAHLWFWLETPRTSAELKAWAEASAPAADKSLFNPVQIHYTSAPVFEAGVADPVPVRSGFVRGAAGDAVPLVIDPEVLAQATALRPRKRGERIETADDQVAYLDEHGWVHSERPSDGALILSSCPFADGHSTDTDGTSSTVYYPAGTGGYEQGHYICLHDGCRGRPDVDFMDAVGYRVAAFSVVTDERPALPGLDRNAADVPENSLKNYVALLDAPEAFGVDCRYDRFKGGEVISIDGADFRALDDNDYGDVQTRLERHKFKRVSPALVRIALKYRASLASMDSGISWIESLTWDGVSRIETFWPTYFGVEDTPYARACGLYTWTALAGRCVVPGVQADMVPVLCGRQGAGKSRGVAALAPHPDLATSISFAEDDKEKARKLKGHFIIEIPEMQGRSRKEAEEIKAWVTRSVDHWVPKNIENARKYPRRTLLFGSTNDPEFLADVTGERRWLPLNVGDVDIPAIVRDRDQLWAEGLTRFRAEGIAWEAAHDLAHDAHAQHRVSDAWEDPILDWLTTPDDIDGTEPAERGVQIIDAAHQLGVGTSKIDRPTELRISRIFKYAGLEKKVRPRNGKPAKVWVRAGRGATLANPSKLAKGSKNAA